jgi:hypothetical protein
LFDPAAFWRTVLATLLLRHKPQRILYQSWNRRRTHGDVFARCQTGLRQRAQSRRLSYQNKRGLGSTNIMALLVQRVSGMPYRIIFSQTLAGVRFREICMPGPIGSDPNKGIIRLVFGAGENPCRDRIGRYYPR